MRTITFYSYKGGVGRTLTLANVALRLARLGQKVVTLDFDLEAPGLHHKWNLDPRRPPLKIERGLVDILFEFVTKGAVPLTLDGYLHDISEPGAGRGSMHFFPAGTAPSMTYSHRLARIDWHAMFYEEDSEGILLFLELKELIRQEYAPDFLLIDARTGLTEMGGVATAVLPDQVFCLMLNSHEHLEGSRAVMRGMLDAPRLEGEPPVKLGAILARYPRTGDEVAERRDKEQVKAYLNALADNLALTLSIPEVLLLHRETSLEQKEQLLLLGDLQTGDPLPLLRDYLHLCSQIFPTEAGQKQAAPPPPPLPPVPPEPLVIERPRVVAPSPPEGLELDRLIRRCPRGTPERRLLEGAAIFAPEAVPLDWAEAAAKRASESRGVKKALTVLQGLGLIAVDEAAKTISLHPLVRARVRALASKKTWPARNRRAAKRVARWLSQAVELTRLGEVEARWAHLEAALEAAERAGDALVWIRINNWLARHLQYRARYEDARARFEQGLARAEQLDPPNPGRVATSLSNLATALHDLGQAAEARPLLERALAIDEKTYGPNHPAVAVDLSNLALVLKDLGQPAEARPQIERALVIDEKTYGPDHPKVAIRLSNLAMVLKDLGQTTEALPLLERALAIAHKALPPGHPTRTTIAGNLASV